MFDGVIDTLLQIHGETIVYKGDGSLSIEFQGVFDETFTELSPESGQKVASDVPTILARVSDLPEVPMYGKQFLIREKLYQVRHPQPDGKGGIRLLLSELDT